MPAQDRLCERAECNDMIGAEDKASDEPSVPSIFMVWRSYKGGSSGLNTSLVRKVGRELSPRGNRRILASKEVLRCTWLLLLRFYPCTMTELRVRVIQSVFGGAQSRPNAVDTRAFFAPLIHYTRDFITKPFSIRHRSPQALEHGAV